MMGVMSWGKSYVEGEYDGDDIFESYDDPPEFDSTLKPTPGMRLAGYGVLSDAFQLGGYFSVRSGELELEDDNDAAEYYSVSMEDESDVTLIGLGLTLKAGGMVASRLAMGFGLDVGLSLMKVEEFEDADLDEETLLGVELFPRLCLDIIVLDTGSFKMAIPISAGAVVVPIAGRTLMEEDEDDGVPEIKMRSWLVGPAFTVGIALGG
jgi:hypothetical protein